MYGLTDIKAWDNLGERGRQRHPSLLCVCLPQYPCAILMPVLTVNEAKPIVYLGVLLMVKTATVLVKAVQFNESF